QIGEEQYDSNVKTQLTLVGHLLPYHDLVKERRHEEPNGTESEQGRTYPSRSTVKCLAFVAQPATQGTEPQHEEDVADNRARNGGFDNVVEAPLECHEGNNEFSSIAKRGIEQTPNARPRTLCQMFCRSAHMPRERHNGTGRSHKDEYRAGVHQIEEQTYWDEHEQEGQRLNPKASKAHADVLIVVVLLVHQLFVELKSQVDFCPAPHRLPLLSHGRMFPGSGSLLGCGIEDLMTRRACDLDVTDRAIGAQF